MDLSKFIVRTKLDNTDKNQNFGDKDFETEDLVYLESRQDVKNLYPNDRDRVCYPTDYAVMNNACMSREWHGRINRKSTYVILRSSTYRACVDTINYSGELEEEMSSDDTSSGVCPVLRLDCSAVIDARQLDSNQFKLEAKQLDSSKTIHTITFGEFPKTYVGTAKNKFLNEEEKKGNLKQTGKKYLSRIGFNRGTFLYRDEYELNNGRYVKVERSVRYNDDSEFSDGSKFFTGESGWVFVEPIKWIIRNWDDLPKQLNPNGAGTAKYIDVRTEEAIISGVPFYPDDTHGNRNLWQNSTIRGYLNGINVSNITTNGNPDFSAPNGGDFTGSNFLTEALNKDIIMVAQNTSEDIKDYVSKKKSRLEKLNPDTTLHSERRQMTDTEMIKSWIDNGESVLLRGPSGIGKTERIRREYGDRCIYLKLTNNMFPEKVVGSVNLQTGQEIPPNYAKEAILACATPEERKQVLDNIQNIYDIADDIYNRSKESDEKIVILLDELLNVKPAVQSLVYTLVLNRFVENGKGLKLPKNVVVVATGNQKKYSSVAEDLAEPLEKRFDHILDMEPKVNEWLYEYAIPNNIHPSVINYISSKQMERRKKDISYFYEEPEVAEKKLDKNGCKGKTNDPRGWSSISNMLYNFERDLQSGKFIGKDVESYLKKSLQTKLRDEWAEEFFDFYNNPTISVEDIMNDAYVKEDLPVTINEKFATMAGLLSADMTEIKKVREFVTKYCSPEHREVFDITWSFDNVDRMQKLVELKEEERLKEERERLFKEKEKEKLLSSQNIPINRFLELNGRVGIKCDAFWKLNTLFKALNKMGKTWANAESYLDGIEEVWDMYKTKTCIDNIGLFDSTEVFDKENIKYVDFDLIDFSGVFTKDEILNYKNRGTQTGIKLTEFCETSDILRIHCDDLWKAKKLCKALHRMKKKLGDGTSYVDNVNAKWRLFGKRACYINNGMLGDVTVNPENIPTYDFGEVDFTGALTDEEIANIKENLKRAEKGM